MQEWNDMYLCFSQSILTDLTLYPLLWVKSDLLTSRPPYNPWHNLHIGNWVFCFLYIMNSFNTTLIIICVIQEYKENGMSTVLWKSGFFIQYNLIFKAFKQI